MPEHQEMYAIAQGEAFVPRLQVYSRRKNNMWPSILLSWEVKEV